MEPVGAELSESGSKTESGSGVLRCFSPEGWAVRDWLKELEECSGTAAVAALAEPGAELVELACRNGMSSALSFSSQGPLSGTGGLSSTSVRQCFPVDMAPAEATGQSNRAVSICCIQSR